MILYFTSINYTVFSQKKALYFNLYNTENGLSQNSINSIAQDNEGFIWLATQSGLNRFDGYEFKKWFQEPDSKNTLSSGFINQLAIDKNNNLWIASNGGIDHYNKKTNIFSHFSFNEKDKSGLSYNIVNSIFIDSDNYLWAGTSKGLNRSAIPVDNKISTKNKIEFIKFYHKKNLKEISDNNIKCIWEDQQKNIWIGTKNGLNKYNKKTNVFDTYFFSKYSSGQNGANEINAIIQLNDSILWIGTEGGLFELNTNSNYSSLINNFGFFKNNKLSASVRSLLLDSKKNIWVGTYGQGVLYYSNLEKKFYHYKKEDRNKNNLVDNFITSLYEDKSGAIFIGTYGKGLNSAKISGNYFELFRHDDDDKTSLSENITTHIYCQDKNTVWMGTLSKGLEKFNPQTKEFTHYPLTNLRRNNVPVVIQFVLPKNKDELWLGTLGAGLLLYNHKTNKFKQYLHYKNKNSISDNRIYWMNNSGDSILWIGTFGAGLDKFNIITEKFEHYSVEPNDSNKIGHNLITFLEFDKKDLLWIGSWGSGLMSLNTKTNKLQKFKHSVNNKNSISSDFVISIYVDNSGILWFGTSTGLNKYNTKTNQFTRFGKREGFLDEFINSIEDDKNGYLWISTNRGIVKFNKQTETVSCFDIKDGLQDNEFSSGINTSLPNGKMIFGGVNGFNVFYPDSIKPSSFDPNIVITEFQLFYKTIEPGVQYENDLYIKESISELDTLTLNYKNNVIGFKFTSLDFTKPSNIKYAFRLKGFEKNWNHTSSNERFARYTNLSYGEYVLQIKSTNGDGVWSTNIKELTIKIKSPFWLTNEFWLLMVILLLLLIFIIYRITTKVLLSQKRKLEKEVIERTAEINSKNNELKEKYEEIVVQEEELREQAEELHLITEQLAQSNESLSLKVKKRTLELENALSKAEDAQKLISSFLSNLSHEIRTPMNAILGFTQIINSIELTTSKRQYYTNIIEENVQTLLSQIDNIMDIAKLHTGQYRFKNALFSVNDLFSSVFSSSLLKNNINKKDFKFDLILNQKLNLNSDSEVLKNIIFNLVENATKYTEKGFVKFGFNITGDNYDENKNYKIAIHSSIKLEIFVTDSGIGIAKNEQNSIFNAFKKIEDDKQKLYRGTGLG